MSQPAISKHLRVLREAGLVALEKVGREHVYRLAPNGMADLRTYLESVSAMWDDALQAFADYVEQKD